MFTSFKVISLFFCSLIFVCVANASGKEGFEDLTERPGTTLGTVIKTPGGGAVIIEKPYGKPATATVVPGKPNNGRKK